MFGTTRGSVHSLLIHFTCNITDFILFFITVIGQMAFFLINPMYCVIM